MQKNASRKWIRQLAGMAVLAALYFAGARLGLLLALDNTNATPVWPPAGIALAGLLLLGWRAWPAVLLGALAANVEAFSLKHAAEPATIAWVSGVIACGNTLEALAGWWLCARWLGPGGRMSLGVNREILFGKISVFQFACVALAASVVSAVIGPLTVCASGIAPWTNLPVIGFTWWTGDATGILFVTPFLLALNKPPRVAWRPVRWGEAVAAFAVLGAACWLVFFWFRSGSAAIALKFVPIAPLVWIALRVGLRSTAIGLMVLALFVILSARRQVGSAVETSEIELLLVLLAFLWVVGLTLLTLGRSIAVLMETKAQLRRTLVLDEAIMGNMGEGLYAVNDRGLVTYVNPVAERILGWSSVELMGRKMHDVTQHHHPDGTPFPASECAGLQVLKNGTSLADFDDFFIRKDGTFFPVTYNAAPLKSGNDITGVVVVFRDASARKEAERRQAGALAVTQILAGSPALEDALPKILQTICATLGWELGAVWTPDPNTGVLRCLEVWHQLPVKGGEFASDCRTRSFPPGIGLPGRVWSTRQPAWLPDVTQDDNFPRAPLAAAAGLRAAFAFRIQSGGRFLGVMEFFSRESREPDQALLAICDGVGNQIGQFMERKRVEEDLQKSEGYIRSVFDSALDSIIVMDHEGRIVDFNPSAEKTFGHKRLNVVGKALADVIIPPAMREAHRRSLARYVATGEGSLMNKLIEVTAMHADGTEFPVEVAITRIEREGPPLFTGFIRDVSIRKRAEAAQAEFAAIVESSDDAIVGKSLDGTIRNWNRGAELIFGYTYQEAVGKNIRMLFPPDRLGEEELIIGAVKRREKVQHYVSKRRRKDGRIIDVSITASPIVDDKGEIIGVSKIARDITERMHAESALRETEARFRTMADAAPVLIWMSGTDKRYTYFNKGWLEFTGRRLEQELGDGWSEGVHPGDVDRCRGTYTTSFDARKPFQVEYRLRRHDGQYRWITDSGIPRFADHEEFTGYMGSCIDITDLKMAEQNLRRLNEELEQRVVERTKELRQSHESLQREMSERHRLEKEILEVAESEQRRLGQRLHEGLGQHLAGVGFLCKILAERLAAESHVEAAAVRELCGLMQESLDATRDMARSSYPVELETGGLFLALQGLVDRTAALFNVPCEFKSVGSATGNLVEHSAIHIYRIVQEALTNAINHGKPRHITVACKFERSGVHITVSDDGVGFDPPADSTGMGLHLMRYRARLLGAEFDVRKVNGGGCRVTFSMKTGE